MALAVLIVTLTLIVCVCCIPGSNELMSSVCCFLRLFDALWLTVMRPENNDVCPVVIPTLKIFQVFLLNFFAAELHSLEKHILKKHLCVNSETCCKYRLILL